VVPPGSKNTAYGQQGSPGTWDALRLPLDMLARGCQTAKLPAPGRRRTWTERRTQAHGMVSPSEAPTKRGEKVRRESEHLIVPSKPGNPSRRDPVEGRRCRVAESLEGNRAGAQEPDPVFTKCQRIAELAQQQPQLGFTSLNHHLDLIWLVTAFNRTRKDGAPGVDGQTADDYGLSLLDNLESLLDRAKSGTYRAPPVRRVRIPKGTGPGPLPVFMG
jgi:hypothetical protein